MAPQRNDGVTNAKVQVTILPGNCSGSLDILDEVVSKGAGYKVRIAGEYKIKSTPALPCKYMRLFKTSPLSFHRTTENYQW